MPPTTTTSAREARSVPLSTRSPASRHVAEHGGRADHERGAPGARVGQQVLHRPADGHHVAQRRPHADPPELRDQVLARTRTRCWSRRPRACRRTQLLERLGHARRGLAADPHAAVQIEDELVVAGRQGAQRHRASLRPVFRRLFSSALCALGLAACGGGDDDGGGADKPKRDATGRAEGRPAAARRSRSPSPSRTAAPSPRRSALDREHARYDVLLDDELRRHRRSASTRRTSPRTAASFASLAERASSTTPSSTGSCPAS